MNVVTMRRPLGRLLVVLGISLLASCSVDRQALARAIDLRDVDLSTVADGTYEAAYTIATPAVAANKTVRVRVSVKGGTYESIDVIAPPSLGTSKAYAALVTRIKETGRLSIDAVSGATVTSAAILKAVQVAVGGKN